MNRKHIAQFVLAVLVLVNIAACIHHGRHVPPGQIKKQLAPGQMKKH